MALTDYTTFNDVRAALGVSEDELEDATLSLDVYVFGLQADLDDLEPSPVASYAEVRELDLEIMTEAQQRFYRAMRLFSTFSVAKQLLASLPMFGPKEISDGKASMVRFSTDPYRETTKRVEAQYERARERLVNALATLNSSTAVPSVLRTYMSTVAAGSDPVTGT